MQKKFSYPVKTDELNQQKYTFRIEADSAEKQDIRDILKVEDVLSFVADIQLKLNIREHMLHVWGSVCADLELKSVVSLENFCKTYETSFELFYDTKATYQDIRDMKADINSDVPDIIENGQIDLADIALEQIALQMEDYPRADGEVFDFSKYCPTNNKDSEEDKQNPFAVLAKLKK